MGRGRRCAATFDFHRLRPDDARRPRRALLLDHLVGEAAAVPELRAALTLTRGLGRPPFASTTNFTSGADAGCSRRAGDARTGDDKRE